MHDKMIEMFKKTAVWKELVSDTNNCFIYIGGSRCAKLQDKYSDYDIVVITKSGDLFDGSRYFRLWYKNTHLHWYLAPTDKYLDKNFESDPIWVAGLLMWYFFTDESVLFVREPYLDWFDLWKANSKRIGKLGARILYDRFSGMITDILDREDFIPYKVLYRLCLCYYVLTDDPVDRDFLIKVKRCKWIPLSDTDISRVKSSLSSLVSFINSNPLDLDKEIIELKKLLALK